MDYGIAGMAEGLNKAITDYVGNASQTYAKQSEDKYKSDLETQRQSAQQNAELGRQTALEKAKQGIEGRVTPDMAEGLIPGSSKWVNGFQKENGRLPTVEETKKGLDSVILQLNAHTGHEDDTQNRLEKQAQDRITQIRGDSALQRAEMQRDAAGYAYDTIAKAKSEGRDLTSLEQTDLIGQLWQARTGKAPTDSDMKMLNQMTAKQSLNKTITYLTGDPSLIGASTGATLDNLQQFVDATGNKADAMHEGYMKPRMVKPTGLSQDRWDHVVSQRGLTYAEHKAVSDKTYVQKPAAGGSGGGWSYVGPVK